MRRILPLLTFAVLLCTQAFGQNSLRPADLISDAQQTLSTSSVDLFSLSSDRSIDLPADVIHFDILDLDLAKVDQLLISNTDQLIRLEVPTVKRSKVTLELVEVTLNSAGSYVTEMPSGNSVKVTSGKHFRGIVKGNEKSVVAISVFEDEVMGFISEPRLPNLVIGKLKDSKKHIVYEDADLKDQLGFACDTPDGDEEYTSSDLEGTTQRALTDCVRIYLEVDHDIYLDKGSNTTTVTNFTTGLFNQVATLYANEQINVVLSPLTIWTQPSPYNSTSSSGMLNAFLANTGAFDGDLAQLISYKASGGIAYVNGLCSSNPDYSKSFSSINPTYQNVPTYSWSVMVMTHEFGHLFGSQHTHACVWNGNNTAIDGCYNTEGGCADVGNPAGGGTIMSYCHLTSVGINLNLGFGPQPGNLIRSRVQNASCTQACDGDGGGGGGGGTTCTDTEATLTIITDNYPGETTWTLKDASGSTLYSGGPYSTQGQTVTETWCLVDGCYDFQINDSYGDGICCGYGQGSYDISIAGSSVASGGQFGSTEVQNFCAGGSAPATCDDGIQNQGETGVDCGGPNCSPCVSCNDGIQNGNETGVDCGGDCDACPTCNDGVQNGSETGIDCGGPDCAPCDNGGGSDSEIFAHFFENGWDGWIDGGSDCYRYAGGRSYEGTYSIRLRDNSGTISSMTSPTYDLSGYSGVEVNFYFYPNSMEPGEDFFVRYYDGSSWQTVASFASGTSFENNTFYTATVPILSSSYNMASNARFRFQCDASANADRIYIDAVTVTGLGSGALVSDEVKISALHSTAVLDQGDLIDELVVSPNPAVDEIRVKMSLDYSQDVTFTVMDILGREAMVMTKPINEGGSTTRIDISELKSGTYLLQITDAEGDHTIEKFLKVK